MSVRRPTSRAKAFCDWTAGLSGEHADAVVEQVLPDAAGMTVGQIRDAIARTAIALDPGWAQRRYEESVRRRKVVLSRTPEGTATLVGHELPADRAVAGHTRIATLARRCERAGDRRPIDLIRADLYLGMLDGTLHELTDRQIIAYILAHPVAGDPGMTGGHHPRSPIKTTASTTRWRTHHRAELNSLCRHHHRLKHDGGWQLHQREPTTRTLDQPARPELSRPTTTGHATSARFQPADRTVSGPGRHGMPLGRHRPLGMPQIPGAASTRVWSPVVAVRAYLGRYGSDIGILAGEPGSLSVQRGPASTNASYLALSQAGFVYAAMEAGDAGAVGAYAVNGDGLRPLGAQPTGGHGTCHVSIDPSGRYLLSADYGSGTVAVHPVQSDGNLGERTDFVQYEGCGPDPDRQDAPHAHMIVPIPLGDDVLAVDLGTDSIHRYRLAEGRLHAVGRVTVPAGAGPRHIAFHPGGRFAYVVNELASSVSVLDLESFTVSATVSTLPSGATQESLPSAIRVSPDGRFCYVANRGPDTIATLVISPDGAELRLVDTTSTGGAHPRDLVLDGDYLYVANQHSGTITSFRVDAGTGRLQPGATPLHTAAPACILLS